MLEELAYLGRYAHQPFDVSLRLPTSLRRRLLKQTGLIVQRENEPARG